MFGNLKKNSPHAIKKYTERINSCEDNKDQTTASNEHAISHICPREVYLFPAWLLVVNRRQSHVPEKAQLKFGVHGFPR